MNRSDRIWPEVRRLLPEADLVVLPPQRADTWIGRAALHRADAADSTAARHLAALWPVLTGGLSRPATAVRSWTPGMDCSAFANLVARCEGQVPDLRARADRAADVLGGDGWTVRRRHGATDARLLTVTRGHVTAEVLRWLDPFAVDVAIRVGPVSLDTHTRQTVATVPFPRPAGPDR